MNASKNQTPHSDPKKDRKPDPFDGPLESPFLDESELPGFGPDASSEVGADDGSEHLRYLLTAYLFGDISEAGKREVEEHLAVCEVCRTELEEMRETFGVIDEALKNDPIEYAFDERRNERVLNAARERRYRTFSRFVGNKMLLAAAGLLLVALVTVPIMIGFLGQARYDIAGFSEAPFMEDESAVETAKDARREQIADGKASSIGVFHAPRSQEPEGKRAAPAQMTQREIELTQLIKELEEMKSTTGVVTFGGGQAQATSSDDVAGNYSESMPEEEAARSSDVEKGSGLGFDFVVDGEDLEEIVLHDFSTNRTTIDLPTQESLDSTVGQIQSLGYGSPAATPPVPNAPASAKQRAARDSIARSYAKERRAKSNATPGETQPGNDPQALGFAMGVPGRKAEALQQKRHQAAPSERVSGGTDFAVVGDSQPEDSYRFEESAETTSGPARQGARKNQQKKSKGLDGYAADSPSDSGVGGWTSGFDTRSAEGLEFSLNATIEKGQASASDSTDPTTFAMADKDEAESRRFRRRDMRKTRKIIDPQPLSEPVIERKLDAVQPDLPKGTDLNNLSIVAEGEVMDSYEILESGDEDAEAEAVDDKFGKRVSGLQESRQLAQKAQKQLLARREVRKEVEAHKQPFIVEFSASLDDVDGIVGGKSGESNELQDNARAVDPQAPESKTRRDAGKNPSVLNYWTDPSLGADQAARIAHSNNEAENFLRSYNAYQQNDAQLNYWDFKAQELSVPLPEVGDEGLGREEFRKRYGVNPFVDTRRDKVSTFAMDVDTASFTRARIQLLKSELPKPESIRVEEFVNYFPQSYATHPTEVFSVACDAMPAPFGNPGVELLRLGIKARELRPNERRNAVLTFAVDVSGSMSDMARIDAVRQSIHVLLDALEPTDLVAIASYADEATLILPHTPARQKERIRGVLGSLLPRGGTNVEAGLDLAYRVAHDALSPGSLNRVILVSDGVANVGARGPEEILKKVKIFARKGIYLSTVGVGMGKYNDVMLERLANEGNGNYNYVSDATEATRIFQQNLPGTLEVLAQDAKIQVEFNPEGVSHYRLLGYENRDIADKDFRNDKIDAGEVGPGTTVTALYEIVRRPGWTGGIGTVRLRYMDTRKRQVDERDFPIPQGIVEADANSASQSLRVLACAAELAELLRDSYYARNGSYGKLILELTQLSPETHQRPEVRDLVVMTHQAQLLKLQSLKQWLHTLPEAQLRQSTEK